MAAVWLADAVGGDLLLGFISAVAFATILAVVSGLTLAGASAVRTTSMPTCSAAAGSTSKTNCGCRRSPPWCSAWSRSCSASPSRRRTSPSWSASPSRSPPSANFPVLIMSMYWRGLTTRGAVVGGWLGLSGAVDPHRAEPVDLGGGARQSGGYGAVPVQRAGAVLHAGRLHRGLAVLAARPQRARPAAKATASRRNTSARRPASGPRGRRRTEPLRNLCLPARAPGFGRAPFLSWKRCNPPPHRRRSPARAAPWQLGLLLSSGAGAGTKETHR